jgi:pimeloyl-ACP methyl ester carboxylesterase
MLHLVAGFSLLALLASFILFSNPSSYNERHLLSYSSAREYGIPSLTRPSIVIVPGLDGITSFFDEIIPELTTAEYHVVVYHLPLYHSPNNNEYSFESIARSLRDLLEELNLSQVVLIGESFGGVVTQYFAYYYPIYISRLILLSSMAHLTLPTEIAWKADNLLPPLAYLGRWNPNFAQVSISFLILITTLRGSSLMFTSMMSLNQTSPENFVNCSFKKLHLLTSSL